MPAPFAWKEHKRMKVYCERCKKYQFTVDDKHTISMPFKCKHCGQFNIYDGSTHKTSRANEPMRKQSSGVRFY